MTIDETAGQHSHPVLSREPLTLRPSTDDDLDVLADWFTDLEVFRWWGGHPLSRDEVGAWEKAGFRMERRWDDHPDGPAVLMRHSDPT